MLTFNFMSVVQTPKHFFDQKELKKMSLSVQCSAVKSLKFNGKDIRTVCAPGLGKCPMGIDVSRAIGYVDDNNGR